MSDVLEILKLYELRRDPEMRLARQWFFNEFDPKKAADILLLYRAGERKSANFRMVVSYWDMAASLVINGLIDEKAFLSANTEHIFVYAKIEKFLPEVREVFEEPRFLGHLEELCKRMPNFEEAVANRKKLAGLWAHVEEDSASAV